MSKGKVFTCVCVFFMDSQETGFVQNRYIVESRRSGFCILNTFDKLSKNGYLVIIDVKKAFDSLDHGFLQVVFTGQFGYSNSFND